MNEEKLLYELEEINRHLEEVERLLVVLVELRKDHHEDLNRVLSRLEHAVVWG